MAFSMNNNKVAAISFGGGCQVRFIFWFSHETTLYYSTSSILRYLHKDYGLVSFLVESPYESENLESSYNMKFYQVAAYGDVNYDPQPHLLQYNYSVWSAAGVGADNEGKVSVSCQ
jgi:hypothetical protein